MVKENYEKPIMDVVTFEENDIIVTSGTPGKDPWETDIEGIDSNY